MNSNEIKKYLGTKETNKKKDKWPGEPRSMNNYIIAVYKIDTNQMEIQFIWLKKTGSFSSDVWVNTTVWMHHMETNKMHKEKERWKLHKNVTSYFEQILETTSHKTVAVQPLTSHLKNHPSKMNKTYEILLEKQG